MGPIASKMKSSSQSPVFITVMWSLTTSSTIDCMIWVADSLTTSLTISADTLTAGSLLDRELLKNRKILEHDILCVVIFRCFLLLWCGYCSVYFQSLQHQETIRFLSVTPYALWPRVWPFSGVFLGCGVGIVKCLFNLLYYVICWLHPSATARNYPIFYHTRAHFARLTKEK